VDVTNDDNEPELSIVATAPNAAEPAANGAFTVSRTGSTAAALTVNYSVGGTATGGSDYTALSGSLTIPIGASSAPIPVQVIDDGLVEAPETVVVTLSPSGTYSLVGPTLATVTIADDDVSGFAVSPTAGLVTTESGGTATFTVRLTSVPSANVTIPVTTSNGAEGLISAASSPVPATTLNLLFTPGNWNVDQTVTLTGVNDAVTDGAVNYTITLGPTSSSDPIYNAQNPPSVSASNQDNEPEVSIVASTANASEPNLDGVFTVTRTGSTASSLQVNYTVSGTASAGSDFATLTGSVVIPAGQASANITVSVIDDAMVELAETVIVTADSLGHLHRDESVRGHGHHRGQRRGRDHRPIHRHPDDRAGRDGGLHDRPGYDPGGQRDDQPDELEHGRGHRVPGVRDVHPGERLVARTITVTGVADHVVDADIAYTILTNPAVSLDPNYSGMDAADVSLTNKNTDVLGFSITPIAGLMTSEGGGTATFTVALTTVPTAVVTLPLTSNNILEGLISSAGSPVPSSTLTLTFTPGNALTPQTVTVTGVNDGAVDGNVATRSSPALRRARTRTTTD
jgi:hypothetical protein